MTLITSQSESLPTTENDTVKTQKSGLTYRKSQPNRRIFVTDSRTARTMDMPYQCRLWLGFRTIFPLSRHLLWMCIVLVLAASLPYCRCQTDVDECASDPCQNNGTCWDQVDGYLCNCTANYTGDNCQIKVCTSQNHKALIYEVSIALISYMEMIVDLLIGFIFLIQLFQYL